MSMMFVTLRVIMSLLMAVLAIFFIRYLRQCHDVSNPDGRLMRALESTSDGYKIKWLKRIELALSPGVAVAMIWYLWQPQYVELCAALIVVTIAVVRLAIVLQKRLVRKHYPQKRWLRSVE